MRHRRAKRISLLWPHRRGLAVPESRRATRRDWAAVTCAGRRRPGNRTNDIGFEGANKLVTIGFAADPALRPALGPEGYLFGRLLQISPTGVVSEAADVSAYEAQTNPAGGPVDTNPFGLLILPGLRIVADAGANALLTVVPTGLVNTLAVFPSRPARATDAVPTSVAIGPDGAYYVGELSGAPVHCRRRECVSRAAPPAADRLPQWLYDHHRHRVRTGREPLRGRALDRAGVLRSSGRHRQSCSRRHQDGPGVESESADVGARDKRRLGVLHEQGHHRGSGRSLEIHTVLGLERHRPARER